MYHSVLSLYPAHHPLLQLILTTRMLALLFCVLTVSAIGNAGGLRKRANATSGYDFVDPLIGTVNGGHVFPGATLPFGMAKAVADVNGEDQGGFASDGSNITGFSHLHDSGTGGSPSLGNFPLFPQAGCEDDSLDNCKFAPTDRATPRINGSVSARPGYFTITLDTSIKAEMTVTNHTALYRFTFPGDANASVPLSPLMIIGLEDLPASKTQASASVDPTTGRMTGNGTFSPSFGVGNYNAYFCADYSGASIRDTGVWFNQRAGPVLKTINVIETGVDSPPAGVYTRFNPPSENSQILARVGVSFISSDQACQNAEKEIPSFDFDGTLSTAEDAWREKLSVIELDATGVDDSYQTIFWSAVYRSMLSPQDYTNENPLWESDEPYYDSYYWYFMPPGR